jgi:Predicted Zn-dependent peptidases
VKVGQRVLFGTQNPYGWPTSGTAETVSRLTLDQIKARHKELFNAANATLLIAGDLTTQEARTILEQHFAALPAAERRQAARTDLGTRGFDRMRLVVVDRPGAVQTVIRYIAPGVPYASEQRVRFMLLNELFGGGFTSRLNQNLREDKGYTYGAGSRYVMGPSAGYFIASSSVRADVTGASLKEFIYEFERIRRGDISPEEAAKAIESLRTETIQRFAGLGGLLGAAAQLIEVGMPWETIARDMEAMRQVDAAILNKIAGPALPIDRGVLVLVGDKALILDQIKDLGLPAPEEYTIQGEPKK